MSSRQERVNIMYMDELNTSTKQIPIVRGNKMSTSKIDRLNQIVKELEALQVETDNLTGNAEIGNAIDLVRRPIRDEIKKLKGGSSDNYTIIELTVINKSRFPDANRKALLENTNIEGVVEFSFALLGMDIFTKNYLVIDNLTGITHPLEKFMNTIGNASAFKV